MLVYVTIVGENAPEAFVLSGPDATVRELCEQVAGSRSAAGRGIRLAVDAKDDERLRDLGIADGGLVRVLADGEAQPEIRTVPEAAKPPATAAPTRRGRRISEYEELTQLLQWHPPFHINNDRPSHEVWTAESTALRCSDWSAYRAPDKLYYRTYTTAQNKAERAVHEAFEFASASGQLRDVDAGHVGAVRAVVGALHFPDWGLCMVHQHATRFALSSWVAGATEFMMFDELRHAQLYGRVALAYEEHHGGFDQGREQWMTDERFQPLRRVVEELLAELDWGKAVVLAGTVVEPLVTTAAHALLTARGIRSGDAVTTFVCQSIARDKERHRAAAGALVQLLVEDPAYGRANADLIRGWIDDWLPRTVAAVEALAAGDEATLRAIVATAATVGAGSPTLAEAVVA
jgi:methane monooxygenase component A beta chain/propane monooxygenase small subunit